MADIRAVSGSSGGSSSTYTIKKATSANQSSTKSLTIETGKNYMIYGTPPVANVAQSNKRELYFYQNGTITKVGDGINSTLTKTSDTELTYSNTSTLTYYLTLFEEA